MMRLFLMFAMLLSASVARADGSAVDQAEILRLGDMVQHIDGRHYGQSDTDSIVEAMRPPEDDADKWFVSVVVTRNCAACRKLKTDWKACPSLLALADPGDSKGSWAHYHEFYRDDQSQAWRFENIKFTGYPTILVQPPRSKAYGDPSTVVYQATYDGDPRALATDMAAAIRQYVAKVSDSVEGVGGPPPWLPAPKDDPDTSGRLIPPLVPDEVAIQVEFPWKAILTLVTAGFSIPTAIGLVVWLLAYIRARRKAADKPLLLDDGTFQRLLDALEQFQASAEPKKTATRRKRSTATKS